MSVDRLLAAEATFILCTFLHLYNWTQVRKVIENRHSVKHQKI